jgi:aminoglycoside phosphotransferase (APT) family kinase protein
MATVMLPPSLAERVELLIGERPRVATATVGGHSNLVFIVGDVVIKAATMETKRHDVAREAELLRAVDGLGCFAPTLIGSSADDEWSVLATIRSAGVAGTTLLSDLQHSDQLAAGFGTLLGKLLRAIHASAPRPIAGPMFERVGLLSATGAALDDLGIDDEICVELMEAVMHPVHRKGVAFLHGDPGLHNVLLDDSSTDQMRITACVDWELGGWGNALTDLAWAYWTLWFRRIHAHAWPALVDAYGRWAIQAVGWGKPTVLACVRSQMAMLLARTDPGTTVRDVWLDRIQAVRTMAVPVVPGPDAAS